MQEERKTKNTIVFTIFKVVLGLIFLILGLKAVITYHEDIFLVFRGLIGPFLLLAGVVTLAISRD